MIVSLLLKSFRSPLAFKVVKSHYTNPFLLFSHISSGSMYSPQAVHAETHICSLPEAIVSYSLPAHLPFSPRYHLLTTGQHDIEVGISGLGKPVGKIQGLQTAMGKTSNYICPPHTAFACLSLSSPLFSNPFKYHSSGKPFLASRSGLIPSLFL